MPQVASDTGVSLSIIVPFYNETAFLRNALKSIVSQRIDRVEVIVVNDNPEHYSTVELETLCEGMMDKLSLKIVQHSENKGLSAARNSGLDIATGTWIGFLDADDYYTSKGLSEHLDYAIETGAEITHGMALLGDIASPNAQLLQRDATLHRRQRKTDGLIGGEEAQFIVSSWSSLYRRDFLEAHSLRFDEAQRKFEDRLFVLQSVSRAQSIAYLGKPTRVWRRRAGSISVTSEGFETHQLQVALLEKCLAHIRADVAEGRLPVRFEKREVFNCVSRLIWDMELIPTLAQDRSEAYQDLGKRVQALLGERKFGQDIFSDAMVKLTSRVGMRTRRGKISRADFFLLHRLMREGDFKSAAELLALRLDVSENAPKPQPKVALKTGKPRLVLHLGMHKTGSTYLQQHLRRHAAVLRASGVLFPTSGLPLDDSFDTRAGGFPGHQGLLRAVRNNETGPWAKLAEEVDKYRPHTVVISCENMSLPTASDRNEIIKALMDRLAMFGEIEIIALARHPVNFAEAFWREWLANGRLMGARSVSESLVDFADSLVDYAEIFAPFEAASGSKVTLLDFDELRGDALWPGFCAAAKLPEDLPVLDVPRYQTPDRETANFLRLVNMLCPIPDMRRAVLRSYFAQEHAPKSTLSALTPKEQIALIDLWQSKSEQFCADRGYAPDVAKWREAAHAQDWSPMAPISQDEIDTLLASAAQTVASETAAKRPTSTPATKAAQAQMPQNRPKRRKRRTRVRVRPRPWVTRLLSRTGAF